MIEEPLGSASDPVRREVSRSAPERAV